MIDRETRELEYFVAIGPLPGILAAYGELLAARAMLS
jgi:hypothetical protein